MTEERGSFDSLIEVLPPDVLAGMQDFIKRADFTDPEVKAKLQAMSSEPVTDDFLAGLQLLVRDDYPWAAAIKMCRGMLRLHEDGEGGTVVEQVEHVIELRAALRP